MRANPVIRRPFANVGSRGRARGLPGACASRLIWRTKVVGEQSNPKGPDLAQGVQIGDVSDGGMIGGHVHDDAVLLARRGDEFFAIGSTCSHYGGPLAEGLVVGDTVRCPWHHACFSLRTGEAVGAPAFNSVSCWRVEKSDGKVFVREKIEPADQRKPGKARRPSVKPERVVIVGGGAAGFAAAEMLRREGFAGSVTLLSADDAAPYDRPNCSKDYLAGNAPDDWMPLGPPDFYREQSIDLELRTDVTGIDAKARHVMLASGRSVPFDKLLLATGAEPVRLDVPGADQPHVHVLRSLGDSRAIIARAKQARRAVVLGASFIGLEVAAALRAREIEVHVVAPDRRPLERVLGREFGDFESTRSTASYSISRRPQQQSMDRTSGSKAGRRCRPISSLSASACARGSSSPSERA